MSESHESREVKYLDLNIRNKPILYDMYQYVNMPGTEDPFSLLIEEYFAMKQILEVYLADYGYKPKIAIGTFPNIILNIRKYVRDLLLRKSTRLQASIVDRMALHSIKAAIDHARKVYQDQEDHDITESQNGTLLNELNKGIRPADNLYFRYDKELTADQIIAYVVRFLRSTHHMDLKRGVAITQLEYLDIRRRVAGDMHRVANDYLTSFDDMIDEWEGE